MKLATESALLALGNTIFFFIIQRLAGSLTRMRREEQKSTLCNSKQFFVFGRVKSVVCDILRLKEM